MDTKAMSHAVFLQRLAIVLVLSFCLSTPTYTNYSLGSSTVGPSVEICETNCIDEEEFVETWMAYTVSNLGGADPTVETLVQMERNCLAKTEQETNTSSKKQKKTSSLVVGWHRCGVVTIDKKKAFKKLRTARYMDDVEGQINQWLLDDSNEYLNISLYEYDSGDSDMEQPANSKQDSNSEISGDDIDPYSSTKAWVLNKETGGCNFYPHEAGLEVGPVFKDVWTMGPLKMLGPVKCGASSKFYFSYVVNPTLPEDLPRGIEKNIIHTPDRKLARKNAGIIRSPRALFSPASFSPTSTTPSSKYAARTNSGKAMCSYGDNSTEWKHLGNSHLSVELSRLVTHITLNTRYMFEQLREKAAVLDDIVDWIGSYLIKKHALDEPFPLNRPHAEPMIVVGRVCCDANGHLNVNSVLLEGTRVMSGGMSVYMDVHQLPQYSLFPGQVIAAEVPCT
uniref:Uncharacterized protein n=1 Tax=Timema poppense TaxID=170557 RepID=A0A7R9CTZ5_TIMPO|nr:unnamed protein product [Timema poppensis]